MVKALAWLRGDRAWIGRNWEDWLVVGYYFGCVAVGVAAVLTDDIYEQSGFGDIWLIGLGVIGIGSIGAWLDRAYRAEYVLILCMAMITFAHAIILLIVGGDGTLQAGMRLLYAPLMMVPFAWHRRRRCAGIIAAAIKMQGG